jgi:HK97 family phage prohead protease
MRQQGLSHIALQIRGVVATQGEDAIPVYQGWASKETKDRHGDVVLASAFYNLSAYLKSNPVVYYDHAWATWDAPSEETLPIGRATSAKKIADEGLRVQWTFSELEFAQKVRYLVDERILNTLSIGFMPEKTRANDDGDTEVTRAELLEFSVVGLPANRDAEIIRQHVERRGLQPSRERAILDVYRSIETGLADGGEMSREVDEPPKVKGNFLFWRT